MNRCRWRSRKSKPRNGPRKSTSPTFKESGTSSTRSQGMAHPIYNAALAPFSGDLNDTFLRAEQGGLKLAIIGRTVALVLLGVWLVGSRARDPARAIEYVVLLSVFAALGLAHYSLIATRFDRRWVKYLFITLDIAIVSALVATRPLYETAPDLP